MKKIGNTTFNVEAIKDMPFAKFDKTYKELLKGATTSEVYEQLTGKKVKAQSPDN